MKMLFFHCGNIVALYLELDGTLAGISLGVKIVINTGSSIQTLVSRRTPQSSRARFA